MSPRRRVVCFVLIAAMLVAGLPTATALAGAAPTTATEPHCWTLWFDHVQRWLDSAPLGRLLAFSEAGPTLDPEGPPDAIALRPTDPANGSQTTTTSDGEAGPELDPNG